MEPVVIIIQYLFKRNNIINDVDSLDTFFTDGISFPKFIALIFNIESIPNISSTPNFFQREKNNNIAFHYLIENNKKIDIKNPDFSSNYGRLQLMKSILINQCFPDNSNMIIEKSNILLKSFGIRIIKKDHMINLKYLSSILNIITDGHFPISEKYDDISKKFINLDAPFIIEKNFMDIRNSYIFMIQIQIIFEVYKEKIDILIGISMNNEIYRDQHIYNKKDQLYSSPKGEFQPLKPPSSANSVQPKNEVPNSLANRIRFFNSQINNEKPLQSYQSNQQKQAKSNFNKSIPTKGPNYESLNNETKKQPTSHISHLEQNKFIENKSGNIIAKFWNPEDKNYEYLNGILNKNITLDTSPLSMDKTFVAKNTLKSEVYQVFKFDEQQYHWIFNEEGFNHFTENLDMNSKFPLILFLNSDQHKIFEFFSNSLKIDIKTDSINDISILSYRKKNDNHNESNIPIFLFLFIPNSKKNHPIIRTIFYQIYSFLFIISDLNITILEESLCNVQISFIKKIIEIYKIYNKTGEEENMMNFPNDKLQILFLFKLGSIQNSKLQEIKQLTQTNQNNYFKSYKDYNHILQILNENNFKNCNNLSNVKSLFQFINSIFSEISGMYLSIKSEKNNNITIKNFLSERFNDLIKGNKSRDMAISLLKKEILSFIPKNDYEVITTINMIVSELAIDENELKKYLEKQSFINFTNLNKKINAKYYWSNSQIAIIKQSHIHYLQIKFFEYIQKLCDINNIDTVFEKKMFILENQIAADKENLTILFKNFVSINNTKVKVKHNHFDDFKKKGTNYVMKEVEKINELEVVVDSDSELKDVIPQDF